MQEQKARALFPLLSLVISAGLVYDYVGHQNTIPQDYIFNIKSLFEALCDLIYIQL